jgi:hypothetical protein
MRSIFWFVPWALDFENCFSFHSRFKKRHYARSLLVFPFVTIVSPFFFLVRLSSHDQIPLLLSRPLQYHTSITAFFLTDYQSPRHGPMEAWLARRRHSSLLNYTYHWVNWSSVNDTGQHLLYPPAEYRVLMNTAKDTGVSLQSRDLAAKFAFALRFFVKETDSRWLFRGTDDTVINFRELEYLLADLESRHDPLQDFVFLGNCLAANRTHAYPQGGSGYLLSRHAAERLNAIMVPFVLSMSKYEDLAFTVIPKMAGLSYADMASGAFCGHMFPKWQSDRIAARQFAFPRCVRKTRLDWPCPPTKSPVRRIVFYHEYLGKFADLFDNAEMFFNANPSLMWWVDANLPRICQMDTPVMAMVTISGYRRSGQT